MTTPPLLKVPGRIRSVEDALAVAGKVDMSAVVILGETPEGLLLLSAGDGDQLTGAQILWLIESGRHLLFRREPYEEPMRG